MNIALIGYGKMGHIIEQIAIERGHEIVCRIDKDNQSDFDSLQFKSADVAIEFTTPQTAEDNVRKAFASGVAVVCGTTGWNVQQIAENSELMSRNTFFWTSNFSIGVNILFALNKRFAELMQGRDNYEVSIQEIHHIHKLDAPSGTAKTLSEQIGGKVPIESIREGEVAGIHTVQYESDVDILQIRHEAKSRAGFALGAVLAAEFVVKENRKGLVTMQDMLKL